MLFLRRLSFLNTGLWLVSFFRDLYVSLEVYIFFSFDLFLQITESEFYDSFSLRTCHHKNQNVVRYLWATSFYIFERKSVGTVFKYLRAVRKELNLVMSEINCISSIKLELKTEHKKSEISDLLLLFTFIFRGIGGTCRRISRARRA